MSEECTVFKKVKIKRKIQKIEEKDLIRKKYEPINNYLIHLENIKNIGSTIDTAPAPILLESFCPMSKYASDIIRLEGVFKENITLLGRLNDISRSHSIYHPKPDLSCTGATDLRYFCRLQYNDQLEKDNVIFNNRLLAITGELPTVKELNKHWNFVLNDIRRRCQHNVVLPELLQRKPFFFVQKNRPMVYLDVGERNSQPLGRLVIILYLDLAPITVKNFIDLCENHRNWPNPNAPNVSDYDKCSCCIKEEPIQNDDNYEYISQDCQLLGTKFTRIFPNLFIYGGNLCDNRKPHVAGIPNYQPEKCKFHHGYKGTLSMCPMKDGSINSEFSISLKPLNLLNDSRLVFGRVIKGIYILDTISSYGTKNGKPQKNIEILDCGILNLNLE